MDVERRGAHGHAGGVPAPPSPSFLAGAAVRLLAAASARGLPRAPLLAALGVDEHYLGDPEARIPATAMYATWEVAMRACRDEAFPIDVGKVSSIAGLGLLGYVLYTRPTIESALHALIRYHDIANDTGRWSLRHGRSETTIAWNREGERTLGMRVANEQLLASFVVLGAHSQRGGIPVLRTHFRHARPRRDDAHARHFGAPPIWSSDIDALVVPRDVLMDVPKGADEVLSPYFSKAADHALERVAGEGSWSAQVARVVSAELGSGIPTLAGVARAMGSSPRTARRRLAAEGTTFDALVSRVQREQATELLAGDASLRDIAFALGFSDASAFSRAYRRWTGRTPSAARGAGGEAGSQVPRRRLR